MYAPVKATVSLRGGDLSGHRSTVTVDTQYPFEDTATITMQTAAEAKGVVPLRLRIPKWADSATVSVNGGPAEATSNGTYFTVSCAAGSTCKAMVNFNPAIRVVRGFNNSVSVHRGPLLFSLPMSEMFRVLQTYAFQSKDYEVRNETIDTVMPEWGNEALFLFAVSLEVAHSCVGCGGFVVMQIDSNTTWQLALHVPSQDPVSALQFEYTVRHSELPRTARRATIANHDGGSCPV